MIKAIPFGVLFLASLLITGQAKAADKNGAAGTKELCLLYTQECSGKLQRLQGKIKQIQAEIANGATVYSPAEIDKLEKKLKAAEDQMDRVLKSGTPGRHQ